MLAQLRQISLATRPLQRPIAGLAVCATLATALTLRGGSVVICGLLPGLGAASVWIRPIALLIIPTAVLLAGVATFVLQVHR